MYNLIGISKIVDNKVILDNINLQLPKTGFVILKGENGAGKSTLLNILGGLDKPTSGKLYFNDLDLTTLSEMELCDYREKYISFIFQNNNLFENSTVKDNVTVVGSNSCFSEIINYLNLQDFLNQKVKKLSGGEQQKVGIARALMKQSQVILVDEATSSLDYEMKNKVFSYLKQISAYHLVIMISHDIDFINAYADMIIEFVNGKIANTIEPNVIAKENNVLPYENKFKSLKFAINNLFVNKKRLILSSILLIFSFIFIWISMSLSSLNFKNLHFDTLKLENDGLILFERNKLVNDNYVSYDSFEDSDIEYLKANKITDKELIIGKTIKLDNTLINFSINYDRGMKIPYYQHLMLDRLSFFNADYIEVDYGRKPKESNEIVISSYIADLMIEYGVMDSNKEIYKPKDYNSLLSSQKLLILGSSNVKIVGIYNIEFEQADVLKKEYTKLPARIDNINNIFDEKLINMAGNIYVLDSFFDEYSKIKPIVKEDYVFKLKENETLSSKPIVFTDEEIELVNGDKITKLKDNEIVINNEIMEKLKLDKNNYRGQKIKLLVEDATYEDAIAIDELELTIVGLSKDNYYINENTLENVINKKMYINKVYINENDFNVVKNIIDKFPTEGSKYTIKTNYSYSIEGLSGFSSFISKIFKIITPLFLILAVIILVNYILNSIDIHMKDIVVLKALGIKSITIELLFIIEIAILSVLSLIISILLYLIIKVIGNNIVSNMVTYNVNFFPFHLNNLLFIVLIISVILFIVFWIINNKTKKMTPQLLYKLN